MGNIALVIQRLKVSSKLALYQVLENPHSLAHDMK